jgi:hypothetical protein
VTCFQISASVASAILSIACYFPYIRDILGGRTKPECASWLIWSVLGVVALFSQYAVGSRLALSFVAVQAVGVTLIFFLSLWRGFGGLGQKDLLALFFACQGIILWHFLHQPLVALLVVVIVDAVGLALTVYKAYLYPKTETVASWALAGLSAAAALFAIDNWSFGAALYPLYSLGLNVLVLGAIWLGKKRSGMTDLV